MKIVIKGMDENGKTMYRDIALELGQQTYIGLLPGDSEVIVLLDAEAP